MESAGILRFNRRDLRHCCGGHGQTVMGIKGLIEMKNAVKRKFLQRCFISSYYQSSKRMSRGSTAVENTICVCVLP